MVKSRAFVKRFGGSYSKANGFLSRAQVHLQAAYCYPTLGWKIRIDAKSGYTLRSSEEITNLRANRRGLESLKPVNEKYLKAAGGAELVAYCVDGNPTTGVAYTSVACDPNSKLKYSINEYSESAAEFGAVSRAFSYIACFSRKCYSKTHLTLCLSIIFKFFNIQFC